ncbi:MAG: hypothetical protein SFY56_13585 [Bacteroidota bacterium]|nr:hypothetical protein [Bacteroidota bacterium]
MSTLTLKNTHSKANANSVSWYGSLIEKLNFSYFGIISMTILIGSILGGISAMFIFENDAPIWQLGFVMAGAMANNVCAIGQAPTKWVVSMFLVSAFLSVLFTVVNL